MHPPPTHSPPIQFSRDGTPLIPSVPLAAVPRLFRTGVLLPGDWYFDPDLGTWERVETRWPASISVPAPAPAPTCLVVVAPPPKPKARGWGMLSLFTQEA